METIWITGVSSGIGEALFQQLLHRGCRLVITARDQAKLEAMAADYPHVAVLAADLTDTAQLQALPVRIEALGWGVDRIIVNAGSCEYMQQGRLDSAALKRVFDINFFAAVSCVDVALPFLLDSNSRGHVVAVSSMSVMLPFQRASYYGASKAALDYYLKSLALDWQEQLDVTLVHPGFVKTPLTDKNDFSMPFLISAEEAAEKIITVLDRRSDQYAFPKRMYWLLKLINSLPAACWQYMNRSGKSEQDVKL